MSAPDMDRPTRLLDAAALRHLIFGASVLGTGGGGSFSEARAIVDGLVERGRLPQLAALSAFPADAVGVSTAVLGGGLTHEDVERLSRLLPDEPPSVRGARELQRYLGRAIDFVYAIEIGPQNTLEAVRLAALLGVPVVDGDCAGRAVPEMQQTTLSVCGIALTPYVVSTFQGDSAIIPVAASDARNEALCRALALASGGIVGVTGFPATAARLRPALIEGTLARCIEIGRELGPDRWPGERVAALCGGRVAFRGHVVALDVRNEGGFFRGTLDLAGTAQYAGERYRIGIQNEYMWSWRGDALDVRCPDLICVLDSASGVGKVTYGHGFENAIETGEDLTVLHLPCAPVWQTDAGRNAFPAPPALQDAV